MNNFGTGDPAAQAVIWHAPRRVGGMVNANLADGRGALRFTLKLDGSVKSLLRRQLSDGDDDMCGQRTAIRRRKQLAKGNRHLPPLQRSRYKGEAITKTKKTKRGAK